MPSHSKQRTEHSEDPLTAEEWQLRILRELHNKKPRPTVEQRKLVAAQTGLDIKWIARWFKRVNTGNSSSKGKLQTGTVGRHLSRSKTAPAMTATPPPTQSIDGSNPVKSPSENLEKPTTSDTPNVFSAPLEYLSSRSGVQGNGRSASGHSPFHSRLHSSGWDIEHPAVAPDLQGDREPPELRLYYPHSHDMNPVTSPRSHTEVDCLSLGIVANNSVYLASQALPSSCRHRTSSPNTGTGMDNLNVRTRNPHTSASPTSAPPGPPQTPTRYIHVNLASERSDPAYMELELGTNVDPPSQTHATPDSVAPTGSQLGSSESFAPLPSMYWLLFDMELDPVVDREQDDVASQSSMEPHVTPTPISFVAKWEDMLMLERRARSASRNAKLVQPKRFQAVNAVEPNRTSQQSGTGHVRCGSGRDR